MPPGIKVGAVAFMAVGIAGCGASHTTAPHAKPSANQRTSASSSSTANGVMVPESSASGAAATVSSPAPSPVAAAMAVVAGAGSGVALQFPHWAPPVASGDHIVATTSSVLNYSYTVTLWQSSTPFAVNAAQIPSHATPVASFSGYRTTAATDFQGLSHDTAWTLQGLKPQNQSLGYGMTAQGYVLSAAPAQPAAPPRSAAGMVVWTEGRWQIVVSDLGNTALPVPTATRIAAYLHSHSLPVPNGQGAVVVNLQPGTPAVFHTMVTWIGSTATYQVQASSLGNTENVVAALQMAASMSG